MKTRPSVPLCCSCSLAQYLPPCPAPGAPQQGQIPQVLQSSNTTERAAELSALQTSAPAGTQRPSILLTRAPPHHMVLAVERSEVCAWRESLVPTHTVGSCAAALLAQHRTRAQQADKAHTGGYQPLSMGGAARADTPASPPCRTSLSSHLCSRGQQKSICSRICHLADSKGNSLKKGSGVSFKPPSRHQGLRHETFSQGYIASSDTWREA